MKWVCRALSTQGFLSYCLSQCAYKKSIQKAGVTTGHTPCGQNVQLLTGFAWYTMYMIEDTNVMLAK